jgi:hypothetical protein
VFCFCTHADGSVEVKGLRKKQKQIITAQIRKIGGKKRSVAAPHLKIAAACRKRRLPIPSYGTVLRRFQAYP